MFRKTIARLRLRALSRTFARKDYLAAYTESTDLKAQIDPQMAIGGLWDEMGRHQFDFLRDQGLDPHHCLLDIGCGSLRGGQYFIDHLEPGYYCGFDLSGEVIDAGRHLIEDRGCSTRNPIYASTRQERWISASFRIASSITFSRKASSPTSCRNTSKNASPISVRSCDLMHASSSRSIRARRTASVRTPTSSIPTASSRIWPASTASISAISPRPTRTPEARE